MPDKHLKRPRDPAQLAKLMIDIASGEVMAAKLTKRLWEIGDIVDVLESWETATG
jgi:hypothetical protein